MPKHPATWFSELHPRTVKFEITIKPHYFLMGPHIPVTSEE